jgi:hypothetical protein
VVKTTASFAQDRSCDAVTLLGQPVSLVRKQNLWWAVAATGGAERRRVPLQTRALAGLLIDQPS